MKLKEKVQKVNDSITINRYDNGYMVEIGGKSGDDDWKTCKILCTSFKEMLDLLAEYDAIPVDC